MPKMKSATPPIAKSGAGTASPSDEPRDGDHGFGGGIKLVQTRSRLAIFAGPEDDMSAAVR
jgi:hypothetical protein